MFSLQAALRCWFTSVLPVVEQERASGGKLALQCVSVLEHLLARRQIGRDDGGPSPVTLEKLIRLMELFHPMPEAGDAHKSGADSKGGSDSSAKISGAAKQNRVNQLALVEMTKMYEFIVQISPIDREASTCAFSVIPALLPLVSSETHSDDFRSRALGVSMKVLGTDPKGLKSWVDCHTACPVGSTVLVRELSGRWQGLGIEGKALEGALKQIESACNEVLLGKTSGKEEKLSEAALAARKNKTKKRAEKAGEVEDLAKACKALRERLAARRTTRTVACFGLTCVLTGGVAAAVAGVQVCSCSADDTFTSAHAHTHTH